MVCTWKGVQPSLSVPCSSIHKIPTQYMLHNVPPRLKFMDANCRPREELWQIGIWSTGFVPNYLLACTCFFNIPTVEIMCEIKWWITQTQVKYSTLPEHCLDCNPWKCARSFWYNLWKCINVMYHFKPNLCQLTEIAQNYYFSFSISYLTGKSQ